MYKTFTDYLIEDWNILTEGIADVRAHYPTVNDEDFYAIVKADPTFNPDLDKVGTYGKWLLTLYIKRKLKLEDLYKATDYLTEFEQKKRFFPNKDIGQFKSLPDLYDALQSVDETPLTANQQQKQFHKAIKKTILNADVTFENDNWIIYIPKDYETSCKLSTDTEWCTGISSKGNSYNYDYYSDQGPLYIIHNKKNPSEKYQFHFESNQFMDATDRPIDLIRFFQQHYDLEGYFQPILLNIYFKKSKTPIPETDDYLIEYKFPYDDLKWALTRVNPTRETAGGPFIATVIEDSVEAATTLFQYNYSNEILETFTDRDLEGPIFNELKRLGCSSPSAKDFYALTEVKTPSKVFEELFPSDVSSKVHEAFNQAWWAGSITGTADQLTKDVKNELEDIFSPLTVELIWDEGLKISGSKKEWASLILKMQEEWYYDNYHLPDDISELIETWIAKNFELREPYAGWYEFDDETWADVLLEELQNIEFTK